MCGQILQLVLHQENLVSLGEFSVLIPFRGVPDTVRHFHVHVWCASFLSGVFVRTVHTKRSPESLEFGARIQRLAGK